MQDFTLTNDEKTGLDIAGLTLTDGFARVDIAGLDNDSGVKYRWPARSS